MRSLRENPKNNRKSSSIRGKGQRVNDADSARLHQVASKMGNTDLTKHLNENSSKRDQLLQFICHRLKEMHSVQDIERNQIAHQREWFKEVAKGKKGWHLPDPTRWHGAAQLFKRAANAICTGHLGRGAQLLNKALELEASTYESVPKMVQSKLDSKQMRPNSEPVEMGNITSDAACSSIARPAGLHFADLILNIQDHLEKIPSLPIQNWWDTPIKEEDEEEEEEQG